MWAVVSMFKNEAPLLAEWVRHYLAEGAAHFFLVDNGSTDSPETVLAPYMERVTLVRDPYRQPVGTQDLLLNRHFLEAVRRFEWVFVGDVDEYLYAPKGTVAGVLASAVWAHKVWVPWKVFGSNGHAAQPPGVVAGFTRRHRGVSTPFSAGPRGELRSHLGCGKMLTRTRHLEALGAHETRVAVPFNGVATTPLLALNHYMLMSRDYYRDVKCVRGGGQLGLASPKYTMAYFEQTDAACCEVVDEELKVKKGL
jgi:hypothetical protein